jgi:ankyrin repeat protein
MFKLIVPATILLASISSYAQVSCSIPNENARSAFAIIEQGKTNLCAYLDQYVVSKTAYNEKCESMYLSAIRSQNSSAIKCLESISFAPKTAIEANKKDAKLNLTPYEYSLYFGTPEIIASLKKIGGDLGGKEIMLAAKNKNPKVIAQLIRNGADVNMTDENGVTPTMIAAQYGSVEVVDLLIKSGADINVNDNDGKNVLFYSVKNNIEVVSFLLKMGFDVNATLHNEIGYPTILMEAIEAGKIEIVESLIRAGADIHIKAGKGSIALHCAINKQDIKIVELLIRSGADIHAKTDDMVTSLMRASGNNSVDIVKTLLRAGAKVNEQDESGLTALDSASMKTSHQASYEIMKALIENGADVNLTSKYGTNSMFLLAHGISLSKNNSLSAARIKLLINAGVNKSQKTTKEIGRLKAGSNAYDYAKILELSSDLQELFKP